MNIRWAQSTRRHKVGRHSAKYVVRTAVPSVLSVADGGDPQIWWLGADERGRVLEVMAVWMPDELMFIHVMPYAFRERGER